MLKFLNVTDEKPERRSDVYHRQRSANLGSRLLSVSNEVPDFGAHASVFHVFSVYYTFMSKYPRILSCS